MQPQLVSLQGALYFNNIASALEAHVREASLRGWALPQQLHPPSEGSADLAIESRPGIKVTGMWPYWLDGRSESTVRNTLDLQNMVILTGVQCPCPLTHRWNPSIGMTKVMETSRQIQDLRLAREIQYARQSLGLALAVEWGFKKHVSRCKPALMLLPHVPFAVADALRGGVV